MGTASARAIYLPADAPAIDWDQLEAATRRPEATICLLSALARYDLTDAIPDALDVAIPRGMRTPMTESAIRWHRFDAATFKLRARRDLDSGQLAAHRFVQCRAHDCRLLPPSIDCRVRSSSRRNQRMAPPRRQARRADGIRHTTTLELKSCSCKPWR